MTAQVNQQLALMDAEQLHCKVAPPVVLSKADQKFGWLMVDWSVELYGLGSLQEEEFGSLQEGAVEELGQELEPEVSYVVAQC